MKTLDSLPVGSVVVITCIDAKEELKQRFFSFGMRRGSELCVKAASATKATIEIEVGGTMIALRREEAKTIQVSPVCPL
ncbi:ferrous iron transport protein A [Sulfurospirillum sp. T05]|uniref:Ferrous iron transport protein A n=1 Tax=Sulfurospirillum tamanense TaxID=2813362 RepID=A0ABS2WRL2_9BACT|nr:FeoA family protein [Sulfurospirillum tamanensis]MBN2963864.1 ferrous iron transport protein A [Sulfurospirillum tamanensis]